MQTIKRRQIDYALKYIDKDKEEDVLAYTQPARLERLKTIGDSDPAWANSLIRGDNLRVLKTLTDMEDIHGKVRLVYIDPPFSTNHTFRSGNARTSTISPSGKDKIAYEDNLTGAKFLEFLRKRLIFLRELLAEDGSIYVHIDWKKGHYLKVLMDEIFGEEHFINDIARIKCNSKNFSRRAYGNIKDMILFYSKTDNYVWNNSKEDYSEADLDRLFQKTDKEGRRYTTTPLHAPGETVNGPTGQPWKGLDPPKGRHWRCSPVELTRLDGEGLIEWSSKGNPRKKIYADEYSTKKKKRQDIWQLKDPINPSYPTEKNLDMLKLIITASSNEGDIILDCFSGSGTTLVAAEELRRKWIGIDTSQVAIDTAQKRLSDLKGVKPYILYAAR